jgi:TolA-binding protein
MRLLLAAFLLPLPLLASEPSAFGAGDLDSDNPYGLTSSEKSILKNKKTLDSIKQKSYANENQVGSLLERVDGLQTVIEGLNEKSEKNRIELKSITDQFGADGSIEQIQGVVKANQELSKANEANIVKLRTLLDEFSKLLDTINSDYVSKKEFNALVVDVNEFKSLMGKELRGSSKAAAAPVKEESSISSADLAKMAKANYDRQRYTKAIIQYETLIDRKYKPAMSNYMIGEMWYYRKDYGKAISYFKESAKLYDKASYMPTLLLHSAISMENTGDDKNAQMFFSAIVAKYPDSKAAKAARSHIK